MKKINRRDFLRLSLLAGASLTLGGCGNGKFMSDHDIQSLGCLLFPEAGHLPTGERWEKILASPHYRDGQFRCLEPVESILKNKQPMLIGWLRFLFEKHPNLRPNGKIPSEKINLKERHGDGDRFIWLGHSSLYLEIGGKKIIVDPVFRDYASPVSFVNRAFDGTNPYTADDFPPLDALLITHDHWDHLDYPTVKGFLPKVKHIVCPLGVGSYLEEWGAEKKKIHEEDWGTTVNLESGFAVTIAPSQHFSGRLTVRNQTEWCGFIVTVGARRVFLSGDGGWGGHFQKIGAKFGPFDLAAIENGQYNEDWHRIHLLPEHTVKAADAINAKAILPIHNGKFSLARHPWDEPLSRSASMLSDKPYRLLTPKIGQPVYFNDFLSSGFTPLPHWWENI